MEILSQFTNYALRYGGIDWVVTITVFVGIFLLGDKKKLGFAVGMISAAFAFIFSFQIKSIANGITAIVLFCLYLRGYINWNKDDGKNSLKNNN